jgi:peroxiredoxin
MRYLRLFAVATILGASVLASRAWATATVGQAAPDFTLMDTSGKPVTLSSQKGKVVVLEWFNDGCPFVHKHYDSSNMQKLQSSYEAKGVVWYSILSSAPGKEGFATGADATKQYNDDRSKATALLLDPKGQVGHLYGAKTTPDMYVVNAKGVLVYKGAIDDKASTDPADIPSSKNYVSAALDEVLAGKPVTTAETKPYGCSVKY